jgi:UDP-N-acetylmuramoylalanine--D-glutamate ligase
MTQPAGSLAGADASFDWSRVHAVVAGLGVAGFAAADGLLEFGAQVTAVDASTADQIADRARLLETLGARVRLGAGSDQALPAGADLVITTGLPPTHPLLVEAASRSVPIWGEPELAWRLSGPDHTVPWLGITGTNGKTTTTQMLASMLAAAGLRTAAVGNIGRPLMETVLDPQPYDVLAVELSSHQLHWSHSLALHSAAVLNLHADHLDWHGTWENYVAAKAKIYAGVTHSCVYNVAEDSTRDLVAEADVTEGARAIGFTLDVPQVAMIGLVEDILVDRAFIPQRQTSAVELGSLADILPDDPAAGQAPHNIANALAAAALARSYGVSPTAVRDGLRQLPPGGHRMTTVDVIDQVTYVDDSKATNPDAADAALRAFSSVVWIAGGQAKGVSFDRLVRDHRDRLRAAVLLGTDADQIADALARHAPQIPQIKVTGTETSAMSQVVEAAARQARAGDAVLLAPACASRDMYSDYAARGDAFAAAVRSQAGGSGRKGG